MRFFTRSSKPGRRRSPVRIVPLTDTQMGRVAGGMVAHAVDSTQAQVAPAHHDTTSIMPASAPSSTSIGMSFHSLGGGDSGPIGHDLGQITHIPGMESFPSCVTADSHAMHMMDHIDDIGALFGTEGGGGGGTYGYDSSPTTPAVDSWDNPTSPIADFPGPSPVPGACSKGDLEGSTITGAVGGAIAGARGGAFGAAVGAGTGAALGALGFGINCATHIREG